MQTAARPNVVAGGGGMGGDGGGGGIGGEGFVESGATHYTRKGQAMTFEQARAELKELAPAEYRSLDYHTTTNSDGIEKVECRVYIHDHEGCTASTWRAALDAMRATLNMDMIGAPDPTEAPE